MKLYSGEDNPHLIEASFVRERYAPTDRYVHAYGCRLSAKRNQRNNKTRDIYCGAYHLRVSDIRSLANISGLPEVDNADLIHVVEDGEIAHASLKVKLKNDVDEDTVEAVKTAIADRLWHSSSGPLIHICLPDRDLDPHPSTRLLIGPKGAYIDHRTWLSRWFGVLRFWILFALWEISVRRALGSPSH